MIPKIIHYCWVGGAKKPESVLYCIDSWKKFCPDYEIREWNETNYNFSKNIYMKQAYEARKWGFVPDYARLDIIYQYGGIYLDTDVEVIKSFDELLNQKAFMGFENTGDGEYYVNCGHGFGAEPHHEIIKEARDLYDNVQFINKDDTYNMLPSPHYTTQILKKYGILQENKDQKINNMMVYASDVLCHKNFRTGKIHKTQRTISIHHFTASWMDEKIKTELEHIQKIKGTFGEKLGNYILVGESVIDKYSPSELIVQLPVKIAHKLKKRLINYIEMIPYYRGIKKAKKQHNGTGKPLLLDTALESDNCGDQIIMQCCEKQLEGLIDCKNVKHIPTHRFVTQEEEIELKKASYKILCGTNILSGNMKNYGLWKLKADVSAYKNTILMGVGFDSERSEFDKFTQLLLGATLNPNYMHSVRDRFSEQRLKDMGITNVIYTACPTMWGLIPEACRIIPREKSKNVVCTITDYCQNIELDKVMITVLCNNYETVYFWIQGSKDLEYLKKLGFEDKVTIISSSLENYDLLLERKDLDYVGTRLHAGIRALSFGHRSIIVTIDNRARCISKDTGLKVIERTEIPMDLEKMIQSSFSTDIVLPVENIIKWKKQFL